MKRSSSCPYMVGLDEDEQSTNKSSSMGEILEQAKKACPAFEQGACPFSGATTADDIRQALVTVPNSHYQGGKKYFSTAIEHVHAMAPHVSGEAFKMPACPVKQYHSTGGGNQVAIHQAFEASSLAAIMSRMAQGLMEDSDSEVEVEDIIPKIVEKMDSTSGATTIISTTEQEESHERMKRSSSRLSIAFKTGTTVSHQAAEDVHFVKNFIRGKIDRGLYSDLVISLYHVYSSLEEELDRHAPKHFSTCHFPKELQRKETLEEDVDFWLGKLPQTMSEATKDYVERIHQIAEENPLLLLSHAYTRYLGDLSGGKVLARVARRAMNLGKDGLAFYNFTHIKSAKLFKDHYRQCLDGLELTSDQVTQLVAEANVAFILNMRIFEELDVKANVPGAKVRDLQDALGISTAESTTEMDIGECPFLRKDKSATKVVQVKKRCPWPFIFLHDPYAGLQDFQTWVVVGLILSFVWSRIIT